VALYFVLVGLVALAIGNVAWFAVIALAWIGYRSPGSIQILLIQERFWAMRTVSLTASAVCRGMRKAFAFLERRVSGFGTNGCDDRRS